MTDVCLHQCKGNNETRMKGWNDEFGCESNGSVENVGFRLLKKELLTVFSIFTVEYL